jgi:hypothetical protein
MPNVHLRQTAFRDELKKRRGGRSVRVLRITISSRGQFKEGFAGPMGISLE